MMKITTMRWVPSFAQGYVRDLRARWACDEAGIPYELRLIGRAEQTSESFRQEQPFGQVPVLEDGDLKLFETGSIVLHIGQKSEVILPPEPNARARAVTWMFAALNSIEPFVQNLVEVDVFYPNEEWAKARRPVVVAALKARLGGVSQWLESREYLEERFTVGDIMMSTVLRDLDNMGVLEEFPVLVNYRKRCEARPAFQKALAAQLKTFADNAPKK